MPKPTTASSSYNVVVTPAQASSRGDPSREIRFDPLRILQAILFGILGAIAGDIGVAAAGGAPLTGRDVWADLVAGAAGGIAGGLAQVAGADAGLTALVGAFVAGFVAQSLFPPSPFPPHSA